MYMYMYIYMNISEGRDYVCLSRQWDGYPLGLGLVHVVEDKPTEFYVRCSFLLVSLFFFSNSVAVSNFSPLPHFVPLVEFKDRIDHWKWIGEI